MKYPASIDCRKWSSSNETSTTPASISASNANSGGMVADAMAKLRIMRGFPPFAVRQWQIKF